MRYEKLINRNKTERQRHEYKILCNNLQRREKNLHEINTKYGKRAQKTLHDENYCRFLNRKISNIKLLLKH